MVYYVSTKRSAV